MKRTVVRNANIVNEGHCFKGSVLLEDDLIRAIYQEENISVSADTEIVDAQGMYLLPGVIDTHVHFRDPGLTRKADLESESKAAAAGGVTSYFDMPNTVPQTTSLEALEEKFHQASLKSRVNYSFYFGATNENVSLFHLLNPRTTCGIKLFMGASTGNMLVDKRSILEDIFSQAPLVVTAHCEDTALINENAKKIQSLYGEDPDISYHPLIRSEEACVRSSSLAIELAHKYGTPLHIAHISTAREVEMLEVGKTLAQKKITAEACVPHLFFCDKDYRRLGTRIKCNPAIKTEHDREVLRQALNNGRIDTIATDHAPHLLQEKEGGCLKAVSGMPFVQFSLVAMLDLVDRGILTKETLIDKMCHAPAELFQIEKRGFIRKGYKADLVLVSRTDNPWTLTSEQIVSKCKWSPLEGYPFHWTVERTFVNGRTAYDKQNPETLNGTLRGEQLIFNR